MSCKKKMGGNIYAPCVQELCTQVWEVEGEDRVITLVPMTVAGPQEWWEEGRMHLLHVWVCCTCNKCVLLCSPARFVALCMGKRVGRAIRKEREKAMHMWHVTHEVSCIGVTVWDWSSSCMCQKVVGMRMKENWSIRREKRGLNVPTHWVPCPRTTHIFLCSPACFVVLFGAGMGERGKK